MGKINAFIRHLITPQYEEVGWQEKGTHMERSVHFSINFTKQMLYKVKNITIDDEIYFIIILELLIYIERVRLKLSN